MEIHITEHKSKGALKVPDYAVRVFVDRDYGYGYFVSEHALFEMLSAEQQSQYLASDDVKLDVGVDVAQRIIDIGQTPYRKRALFGALG